MNKLQTKISKDKDNFEVGEVLPYGMTRKREHQLFMDDKYYYVSDAFTTTRYPKTKSGLQRAKKHIASDKRITKEINR